MKHIIKLFLPILTGFAVFLHIVTIAPVLAATQVLTFSPDRSTYRVGQQFSVVVAGNIPLIGGVPTSFLNTKVSIRHDPRLQFVSVQAHNGGNASYNGSTITYTKNFHITGQKLFTVTFKAVSPGKTVLNVGDRMVQGMTAGIGPPALYTIESTAPAPAPAPAPKPAPTPAPTPAPKPAPTPAPAPAPAPSNPGSSTSNNSSKPNTSYTPPAVAAPEAPAAPEPPASQPDQVTLSKVSTDLAYDSAGLAWKTSRAGSSTLVYGTDKDKQTTKATVTDKNQTSFSTALTNLQPGVQYFYTITARADGSDPAVRTGSFTTKAYPIVLKVSQDDQPVANAQVKLEGIKDPYTTNDKGEVSVSLKADTYKFIVTKDEFTKEGSFTVKQVAIKDKKAPETQTIPIEFSAPVAAQTGNLVPLVIGSILGLLLLTLLAAALVRRKRGQRMAYVDQPLEENLLATLNSNSTLGQSSVFAYQPPHPLAYQNTDDAQQMPYNPYAVNTANSTDLVEPEIDIWDSSYTPPVPQATVIPPTEYPAAIPEQVAYDTEPAYQQQYTEQPIVDPTQYEVTTPSVEQPEFTQPVASTYDQQQAIYTDPAYNVVQTTEPAPIPAPEVSQNQLVTNPADYTDPAELEQQLATQYVDPYPNAIPTPEEYQPQYIEQPLPDSAIENQPQIEQVAEDYNYDPEYDTAQYEEETQADTAEAYEAQEGIDYEYEEDNSMVIHHDAVH